MLDTNVVLDWLLFGDPSALALAAAVEQRRVRWIATQDMRNELANVLGRGLAARRNVDQVKLLARWDAHVEPVAVPGQLPVMAALHCTDPDDQKFLDLAIAAGATWLLSHDRAVLRLARRAARLQVTITAPGGWLAPT